MTKPILFASSRPLERAENIKAVWDAYHGEKDFVKLSLMRDNDELSDRRYGLLVTDEFVQATPGKCVMIGHAIPGGKSYGLDQPYPYHTEEDGRLLSVVVSSSMFMSNTVARQSGVNIGNVFPLGMPRTDCYFKANITKPDKRQYLFVPTYKGKFEGENVLDNTDFGKIDRMLSDDEEMIVKVHMVDDDPVFDYRHIKVASNEKPSAEYLMSCDVLITDYSSIMFDANIIGKPVLLFAKDRAEYMAKRGMYFPYPKGYSGRFCDTEEELVRLIREAHEPTEQELTAKLVTAQMCDGHSTERVVQLINAMR